MRKALVVGINQYALQPTLYGCVNDAYAVKAVLERHSDGTRNFGVWQLTASRGESVSRSDLRARVQELFKGDAETALLYFAGHGYLDSTGGYILASDARTGDEGLSLADVLTFANASRARNKIIILDSCHAGMAGARPAAQQSELSDGLTILTASTAEQYALEENSSGVFTNLFVDAMNGAAANLVGDVTPGGVYAHIDQSLGEWEQRPVFKTNVQSFVSLRKVQAPITLADLHRITELFPSIGYEFPLDPSFEPEGDNPHPENTEKFGVLQKYARVNLVVPVGAPHMYHAAMESKSCKLTVLGEHYRRLVEKERI
ncbi:MAG TPA: caspase family protein [Longimicrobium sp.]|nr:caspase family protein [Longimicrobium sp.]